MAIEELTNREQEVLACIAEGLSNGAIGIKLRARPFTIRNHIREINAKLFEEFPEPGRLENEQQYDLRVKAVVMWLEYSKGRI